MKRIKLINYSMPDKSSIYKEARLYTIAYGNGLRRSLSNKKYLTQFMNYINKELNTILYKIIIILKHLSCEYYNIWYSFEKNDKNMKSILFNLQSVMPKLELAVTRCKIQNGNQFTFLHLKNAIIFLMSANKLMIRIRKKNKQYAESKSLEIYQDDMNNMLIMLDEMGINWDEAD